MDTMPPQAPPAITTAENEATVATLRRMADTQAWILAQEQALPTAPANTADGDLEAWISRLDAFWEMPVAAAPGEPRLPRHDAMAARLATLMADDAGLMGADGSLPAHAVALARSALHSAGNGLPGTAQASELLVGNVAYAGALVVTDDAIHDLALLFDPQTGWQAFASLDDLHHHAERMIRERIAASQPTPGVVASDVENVLDLAFVSSRAITGDVADTLVRRIRGVQEEQSAMAWALAQSDVAPEAFDMTGALARAALIHPRVDVASMLATRDAALQEAIVDEQLARAPADARAAWRAARAAYDIARVQATTAAAENAWPDAPGMDTFAREHLTTWLAGVGIAEDPSSLIVDVFPAPATPSLGLAVGTLEALRQAWAATPAANTLLESTTLTALALRNLPAGETRKFLLRTADGRDLSTVLSPRDLPAQLRRLDLGGAYREEIARALDKSFAGKERRAAAKDVQLARMSLELEDARIGEYQPGASRAFNEDREERGYRWVRSALDAARAGSPPAMFGGHEIMASQVFYKGHAVKDMFVFGSAHSRAVPNVVLYTPDAPDGRTFREFDSQADAENGLLYDTRFQEYLLERLPASAGEPTPHGTTRRFRVSDASALRDFALNEGRPFGTRTDEPFVVRTTTAPLLDDWYDAALKHLDASVAVVARSAEEADADAAFRIDPEAIARRISGFIGRPFQAAWRAYDAVKAGDHASAFVDATEAWTAGLDIAGIGALLPHAAKPILIRVATRGAPLQGVPAASRLVSSGVVLAEADLIAEPRFLARGVSLREADNASNGIYRIHGKPYIQSGNALYGVRYDSTFHVWRLAHPDGSALTASSPLVRRPSGRWMIDTEFGGPGGAPPARPIAPGAQGARWNAALRRRANLAYRRVCALIGVDEARRAALTVAYNRSIGRDALRGLTVDELAAVARDFTARRTGLVRQAPRRSSSAVAATGNGAGALDLSTATRPIPIADWPNQIYTAIPAGQITANGIITPQYRIASSDGVLVSTLAPVSQFLPLGGPLQYTWVRIDLNAIARRLNDPAYAGFSLSFTNRLPAVARFPNNLPAAASYSLSSALSSPLGTPVLRILPGDFVVLP